MHILHFHNIHQLGQTPLHLCAACTRKGSLELFELLFREGADDKARTNVSLQVSSIYCMNFTRNL